MVMHDVQNVNMSVCMCVCVCVCVCVWRGGGDEVLYRSMSPYLHQPDWEWNQPDWEWNSN